MSLNVFQKACAKCHREKNREDTKRADGQFALRPTADSQLIVLELRLESFYEALFVTMVQDMSYNTTSIVIESWEQLKRMKNYEQVAGAILFQK